MRILIVTQKVDINDSILGFFHRWIVQFAKSFELVTVICLQKGEYSLPANVKVLSLGKEDKQSRLQYILRFYTYIWQERKNYDVVFVHMNQEYVLHGWKIWKLLGKKIYLWRNHKKGNILTNLAVLFSNKVFCTSPESFTARFKKTALMPVGVDTDLFKPNPSIQKLENSVLFLGRISPVKYVDVFIAALNLLKEKNLKALVTMIGDPLPRDAEYHTKIQEQIIQSNLSSNLQTKPGVPYTQTVGYYQKNEIYVNLTPSGSMDKTILEAMASGCVVVCVNNAFEGILPNALHADLTPASIASVLEKALLMSVDDRQRLSNTLRTYVEEKHSLRLLVEKLKDTYTQ